MTVKIEDLKMQLLGARAVKLSGVQPEMGVKQPMTGLERVTKPAQVVNIHAGMSMAESWGEVITGLGKE